MATLEEIAAKRAQERRAQELVIPTMPSFQESPAGQGLLKATDWWKKQAANTRDYMANRARPGETVLGSIPDAERQPDIDFSTWPKQTGPMIDDTISRVGSYPKPEEYTFTPGRPSPLAGDTPTQPGVQSPYDLSLPGLKEKYADPYYLEDIAKLQSGNRISETEPGQTNTQPPTLATLPRQNDIILSPYEKQLQRIQTAGFDPKKESQFLGVASMPGLAMYSPKTGWVQGMNPATPISGLREMQKQSGELAKTRLMGQTDRDVAEIQAQTNKASQRQQKRFTNVTYDDQGNTRDYDSITGESRTNEIYDKFRRPTIDIAGVNPELAAQNLSALNKTNPEAADQIVNELSQRNATTFKKIMALLERFK